MLHENHWVPLALALGSSAKRSDLQPGKDTRLKISPKIDTLVEYSHVFLFVALNDYKKTKILTKVLSP